MPTKSDRSPIAAQPDRYKEKHRGQCEANPQTRRTKKMVRNECSGPILRVVVRGHRASRSPRQALLQQREEIRSVEGNLLDSGDHERRQESPYKWLARGPCRNHQQPAAPGGVVS